MTVCKGFGVCLFVCLFFVKASLSQPENLSFNIKNQQCTNPVRIAKGFNDLFTSFFTHTDDYVVKTSLELEVQNKNTMLFGSDQVLVKIKKLPADKAVGPDHLVIVLLCAFSAPWQLSKPQFLCHVLILLYLPIE